MFILIISSIAGIVGLVAALTAIIFHFRGKLTETIANNSSETSISPSSIEFGVTRSFGKKENSFS